ncbi:MAG: hypothetical protein JSV29_05440 [Candidatus Bathyarchaeota archaeon]|nr:MAG: hypothetical protein JSV29_05440 [Candidatus Bathyarchaeota archaeon]
MDVATISAAVAAISVVVGVAFAIFQMRDAAKTRHTELIIQLNPALKVTMKEIIEDIYKIWNLEFKDYKDYLENYGDPLSDEALHTITGYYDGLGYLLHKRLIDIDTIEYILSGSTTGVWEKLKPITEGMRKQYNLPELFKWFEYLYKELQKREQRLQQTQR